MAPYNREAFERAYEKLRTAPLELNDADVQQLQIVNPALVEQAHAVKKAATFAILDAATVPVVTKSAPAPARTSPPVSQAFLLKVFAAVIKPRDETNAALQAEIAALKERVRVLEQQEPTHALPPAASTGTHPARVQ